MIIATIFAVGTLVYVVVEIILDQKKKKEEEKKEEPVEETPPPEEPVIAPPPPIIIPAVMPAPVEHIDAEEADEMISDELAMESADYEGGAGHGKLGIVNIGDIDKAFNAGDVITLAILKEKGMIPKKSGRMKVLADGILTKPFTVKSESYSVQAIKMIELTGGKVIILKDDD